MTATVGVHFCGSIRLPDKSGDDTDEVKGTENVLRAVNTALYGRLPRVPDGETGKRHYFLFWQRDVFMKTPWIISDFALKSAGVDAGAHAPGRLEDIVLGDLQYDKYAIQSYQVFAKLKKEGVIAPKTRFQVCLPTPMNPVTLWVKQELKAHVETLYEASLVKVLDNIQRQIPLGELAIQWDCPMEIYFLEGVTEPWKPHFEATIDVIVERIARLASAVRDEVQMGFHLCYGDAGHSHFKQPKDTALMVELANGLLNGVQRSIDWIHMPVPTDRTDEGYFEPLKSLKSNHSTELYLGLVHANDLEGTQKRINAAQTAVPGRKFGVATECGLGRTPHEEVASIFEILKTVSTQVDGEA